MGRSSHTVRPNETVKDLMLSTAVCHVHVQGWARLCDMTGGVAAIQLAAHGSWTGGSYVGQVSVWSYLLLFAWSRNLCDISNLLMQRSLHSLQRAAFTYRNQESAHCMQGFMSGQWSGASLGIVNNIMHTSRHISVRNFLFILASIQGFGASYEASNFYGPTHMQII